MGFKSIYSVQLADNAIRKLFIKIKQDKFLSCNNCNSKNICWISERKYRCKNCWKTSSFTKHTFLERSKTSFRFWYEIAWCFTLSHSAHKTGKLLKTDPILCWRYYQLIRLALTQKSQEEKNKITGTVEVDESYYGGMFKNLRKEIRWKFRREGKAKRGRGAVFRKQPVFGIFKRNGSVYLELIAECSKQELEEIIKRKVEIQSEIFSDTFKSYNGLVALGYIHQTVDHGMEIYVDGRVHINGMEGFWGLSKTNMHTYKGIAKKNWILYLKEMEFRFNNRNLEFEELVLKIIKILLSYRRKDFVPY